MLTALLIPELQHPETLGIQGFLTGVKPCQKPRGQCSRCCSDDVAGVAREATGPAGLCSSATGAVNAGEGRPASGWAPGGRGMCRDLLDAWPDEQQQAAELRRILALNPLNKMPQQPGGRLPRGAAPCEARKRWKGCSEPGTFQGLSALSPGLSRDFPLSKRERP